MSEQFPCPHCGKTLSHAPEYAGVPLACPYCKQAFIMADGDATAANGTPTPLTALLPTLPMQRPGFVSTIGIIGIILAALGLLATTCLGSVMLMIFLVPEVAEKFNATMAEQNVALQSGPDVIKGFAFSLALLILSIALLRRREYARRWFQILALVNVIFVVMGIVLAAQKQPAGMVALMACFNIPALIYFILSLICLRGRRARTWFAARPSTMSPPTPMLNGT